MDWLAGDDLRFGLALGLVGAVLGVLLPPFGLIVVLDVADLQFSTVLTYTGLPICLGWGVWVHYRFGEVSSLVLLWLLLVLDGAIFWISDFVVGRYMLPGFAIMVLGAMVFTISMLESSFPDTSSAE